MTDEFSFGAWVRRRRRALDMTQADLARHVGCAEVTIQKIERDECRPSRQIAALLAEYLQIAPEQRSAFLQAARAEQSPDQLPPPGIDSVATPAPLPGGALTFVFTDIEGSTRLWETQPQAMAEALARHNTLLSNAIAANHGYVFKTVGDAFHAAFVDVLDALHAAVEIQRALSAEAWPTTEPLMVRVALHTGMAQPSDNDYAGPTLNRVARLRDIGHGGQVLLSQATASLVSDNLPPDIALHDLGLVQLRDLSRPEPVSQAVIAGLPAAFPPLRASGVRVGRLPAMPTPLIGRERELADLCDLLRRPMVRLVTLTGTGGTGKTRLALAAAEKLADEYPDGVWFVDLASVNDPAQVAPTIAQTLGIQDLGYRSAGDVVAGFLHERSILLLLDNCEQILDAGELFAHLLRGAPYLNLLATSRAPLRLRAEQQYQVPPLELPPIAKELSDTISQPTQHHDDERQLPLSDYAAVKLFIARAQEADAHFELTDRNAATIAEICWRLEGLPLAIELAAARMRTYGAKGLLTQLARDGELEVLVGGARDLPVRQRTLRAAIAWSFALLEPEEQAALARLSIFAGSFDPDAALAIAGNPETQKSIADDPDLADRNIGDSPRRHVTVIREILALLVDHSLLRVIEGHDDSPCYVFPEPVREFAREQLQLNGEFATLEQRFVAYYLTFAEAAAPHLRRGEQLDWLARLDADYVNVRAILTWAERASPTEPVSSTRSPTPRHLGLRLAGALWYYWILRGRFGEAYRWLEAPWARDEALPANDRARALLASWYIRNHATGGVLDNTPTREEGLRLARQGGDRWLIAFGLSSIQRTAAEQDELVQLTNAVGDPWLYALALALEVVLFALPGDIDRLRRAVAAAVTVGDRRLMVEAHCALAYALQLHDELGEARQLLDQALAVARELGGYFPVAAVNFYLGQIFELQGEYRAARETQRERLACEQAIDHASGMSATVYQAALLAVWQSDFGEVEQLIALHDRYYPTAAVHPQYTVIRSLIRFVPALMRGDMTAAERHGATAFDASCGMPSVRGDIDLAFPANLTLLLGASAALCGDGEAGVACYSRAIEVLQPARETLPYRVPGNQTLDFFIFAGLPYAAAALGAAGRAWLEECITGILAIGNIHAEFLRAEALGRFLLLTGDSIAAIPYLAEALQFYRRSGGLVQATHTLEGLAGAALALNDPTFAVRLLGAATSPHRYRCGDVAGGSTGL